MFQVGTQLSKWITLWTSVSSNVLSIEAAELSRADQTAMRRRRGFGVTRESAARGFVGEIRCQPAFDALDRSALALRIVRDLVFADAAHREIARLGVRKVQTADARGGRHRGVLGQADTELARAEQIEELELLAVVGTCRIPERGTNAAMPLRHDRVGRHVLVDAPFPARRRVEISGERLREAVRERLDDNRVVVVALRFDPPHEIVDADAAVTANAPM